MNTKNGLYKIIVGYRFTSQKNNDSFLAKDHLSPILKRRRYNQFNKSQKTSLQGYHPWQSPPKVNPKTIIK